MSHELDDVLMPMDASVGDDRIVEAWASWVGPWIVAWDDEGLVSETLEALVPWWRAVVPDSSFLRRDGDAAGRVGRDAEGRPLVVEDSSGRALAAAAIVSDDRPGGPDDSWQVALDDGTGRLAEVHLVTLDAGVPIEWWIIADAGQWIVAIVGVDEDESLVARWKQPRPGSNDDEAPVDAMYRLHRDGRIEPTDARWTVDQSRRASDRFLAARCGEDEVLEQLPPLEWVARMTAALDALDGTVDETMAEALLTHWRDEMGGGGVAVVTSDGPPYYVLGYPGAQIDDLIAGRRKKGRLTVGTGLDQVVVEFGDGLDDSSPFTDAWLAVAKLADAGPIDFETDAEERATDAVEVRVEELMAGIVGAVNHYAAAHGDNVVALFTLDDQYIAKDLIDTWLPQGAHDVVRDFLGR